MANHARPREQQDGVLIHQLAQTRRAFGEFAYTLAHDLSAPLRAISLFSQLLEQKYATELDDKALHYIDVITENSRKAQARLASLLQYSRLDTVPLAPEKCASREAADQVLAQLKDDIEAREALVRVGPMPEITADKERLALLFYCLISNALKFSSHRPDFTIGAQRAHNAWAFSVADKGIGIAHKDQENIFDIFHRLHREEEYPGTGMGLALARRIVQLHSGMLWVESSPGRGATFIFTIPDAA